MFVLVTEINKIHFHETVAVQSAIILSLIISNSNGNVYTNTIITTSPAAATTTTTSATVNTAVISERYCYHHGYCPLTINISFVVLHVIVYHHHHHHHDTSSFTISLIVFILLV